MKFILSDNMKTLPEVRIAVADMPLPFAEMILGFVKDRYALQITNARDAEYVFHSIDGCEVLNYAGVRIFVSGEYVTPNFNLSDYALTFDSIEFGDRYCRLPLIKLYKESYQALVAPRPPATEALAQKTGFCAYVMTNTKNCAPEREQLVEALETYKSVALGGKWRNNVGGPVPDKITFQTAYKFVLAVENYSAPGYLTEKFAQAAKSNAIPIYWGDPTITQFINPKAFINCHDFSSMDALLARVRELDCDDDAYRAMLSEPWFINSEEPREWRDATFTNFLCNIFDQPHELAYRRNRSRWGIKAEDQLNKMANQPFRQSLFLLKKKWRQIRRK